MFLPDESPQRVNASLGPTVHSRPFVGPGCRGKKKNKPNNVTDGSGSLFALVKTLVETRLKTLVASDQLELGEAVKEMCGYSNIS